MKLSMIVKELNLKPEVPFVEDMMVQGAYTSDLLSDVIANSMAGDLWLTLQGHQNIIAVALLNDLAGVIVTGGYQPNPETISKARAKHIALFTTKMNSYEVSGRLYHIMNQE